MRALIVVIVCWSAPALACSLLGEERHEIDPAEQRVDTKPPGPAGILEAVVNRNDEPKGCGAVSSCGDLLTVTFTIAAASDDRTTAEKMGYELEIVSANPRGALPPPSGPLRARGGHILLYLDPDLDGFEATVRVTPIDLAGNLGPTSAPFTVREPGRGGCAVARRARASDLALPLAFAILLWFRRRASRGS